MYCLAYTNKEIKKKMGPKMGTMDIARNCSRNTINTNVPMESIPPGIITANVVMNRGMSETNAINGSITNINYSFLAG